MDNKRFIVSSMPTNDKGKVTNPSLWLGGKWLKDYGFSVGDKLEVIHGKNMLVLVKVAESG